MNGSASQQGITVAFDLIESEAQTTDQIPRGKRLRHYLRAAGGILAMFATGLLAILAQSPPEPALSNASTAEFSAERAMAHTARIASAPHPVGSGEHGRALEYISAQLAAAGLEPQTQETNAIRRLSDSAFVGARVRNVMARIGSGDRGKAILLAAHYDSVPHSNGASDDGLGVATVIEAVRALKSGPPLRHDVIALLTDGEEIGLLGAKAFMEQHPWAKDVNLALNFEARGNSGPVVMFETTDPALVRQFAEIPARPVSNSLFAELYRLMPYETDLNVFKDAGVRGVNFAITGGQTAYHSSLDTATRLDGRSLQDMGSIAVAFARGVRLTDRGAERPAQLVWFNALGRMMVSYSRSRAIALVVIAALLVFAAGVMAYRARVVTGIGVAGGIGTVLAAALVFGGVAWLVLWAVPNVSTNARWLLPYRQTAFVTGLCAIALCVTAAIFGVALRKFRAEELLYGAILIWTIAAVAAAAFAAGATFITIPPMVGGAAAIGVLTKWRKSSRARVLSSALVALPTVAMLAPTLLPVATQLDVGFTTYAVLAWVLICALLAIEIEAWPHKVIVPICSFAVAVGCMVYTFTSLRPSKDRPLPTSLFYLLDTSANRAYFASAGQSSDPWSSAYLGSSLSVGPLGDVFPNNRFHNKSAAIIDGRPPELTVTEGAEPERDQRSIRLQITSGRRAPVTYLYLEPGVQVIDAAIDGVKVPTAANASVGGKRRWNIALHGMPADGFGVSMTVKGPRPLRVIVVDQTYGLPTIPGMPGMPEWLSPASFSLSYSTLIAKAFQI